MLNANFASHPYVGPVSSYSENLGRAARCFIAALLAIDPETVNGKSAKAKAVDMSVDDSLDELDRLARHFDAIMPNQAAELRHLLSRS